LDEFWQLIQDIANKPSDERVKLIALAAQKLPSALLDAKYSEGLAQEARKDSVEGYCAFYEGIHGFRPPEHILSEVEKIFEAHDKGMGYTLNGWRGSWKSVSLSVTFQAWRIGLEPRKTNVTISANDDSAEKITKAIAAMIEYHPFWKMAFPTIVPDSGRWSVEGYWVVDNSMAREEWAKLQAGVIDPAFVGGGHGSTRVNGKHPTGVLDIDDLHDINNSSSDKERKALVKALTTVILKTAVRIDDKLSTWVMNIGVPWAEDDSHHILKNAGWVWQEIPAMKRAEEGKGVYIDGINPATGICYEDIKGWWLLTEPRRFGVNSIIAERALGKAEFWQMIMLDLATASAGKLKYYPYPHEEIKMDWPTQGGADPTNVDKPAREKGRRSSFAHVYIAKLPMGGAVIVDGVLQPSSLAGAIIFMREAQTRFSNWLGTACEDTGGGSVFIQGVHLAAPDIRIYSSDLSGILKKTGKVKSKPDRILELSNWFENGRIKISDADTPFLNALRKLLNNFFDLMDDMHNEAWDAGDAAYHAVKAMPDVLQMPVDTGAIPSSIKPRRFNPLAIKGHVGY